LFYICLRIKTNNPMTTTFTQNDTTYTTTIFFIKSVEYRVTVAVGKFNYVNVNKITALRKLGRDFANFTEAAKAYKTPQIKIELLKIELGIS
jgi:hypothetical protein